MTTTIEARSRGRWPGVGAWVRSRIRGRLQSSWLILSITNGVVHVQVTHLDSTNAVVGRGYTIYGARNDAHRKLNAVRRLAVIVITVALLFALGWYIGAPDRSPGTLPERHTGS